jgi:hypothetical protein
MTLGPRTTFVALSALFFFVLSACGGTVEGNTAAEGGTVGTGGTVSAVGGMSTDNNGGASACCLAMAVCDAGDFQISDTAACPYGLQCYSREICCSRIQCARQVAYQDAGAGGGTPVGSGGQCSAIPTCPAGDTRILGACPTTSICYPVTLCGSTITCGFPRVDAGAPADAGAGDDASTCSPMAEYNRDYVAESVSVCMAIKYACPAGTVYFGNSCGCGCEQPSSCPQYVNCMPGLTNYSPLCSNSSCPYTIRLV